MDELRESELERVAAGKDGFRRTLRNIDDASLAHRRASEDVSALSRQLSLRADELAAEARRAVRNFNGLFPGK